MDEMDEISLEIFEEIADSGTDGENKFFFAEKVF